MNLNRKKDGYVMPNSHTIRIMPNWFLGFTEGEGCFYVDKKAYNYMSSFIITQSLRDEVLMKKVANYLNNIIPYQSVQEQIGNVTIWKETKARNDSSFGQVRLTISHSIYIKNVLITFFDSLVWRSKKSLDFQDLKTVFKLKELGRQYEDEGIKVLDLIKSKMNTNRLSTNTNKQTIDLDYLQKEIDKLPSRPSNLKSIDGRIHIKSLNRFKGFGGRRNTIKVKLQDSNGLVIKKFDFLSKCGESLLATHKDVRRWLENHKPIKFEGKICFIKEDNDNSLYK